MLLLLVSAHLLAMTHVLTLHFIAHVLAAAHPFSPQPMFSPLALLPTCSPAAHMPVPSAHHLASAQVASARLRLSPRSRLSPRAHLSPCARLARLTSLPAPHHPACVLARSFLGAFGRFWNELILHFVQSPHKSNLTKHKSARSVGRISAPPPGFSVNRGSIMVCTDLL